MNQYWQEHKAWYLLNVCKNKVAVCIKLIAIYQSFSCKSFMFKKNVDALKLKHFRCTSITYYFMLWKLRTMINATCEIRDISKSTIYQKHLPTFFKSKSFFICMRKKANETKLSLFCIPNKGFQKVLGYRQTPRFSDQTKLLLFSFLVRIWNDAMGL